MTPTIDGRECLLQAWISRSDSFDLQNPQPVITQRLKKTHTHAFRKKDGFRLPVVQTPLLG